MTFRPQENNVGTTFQKWNTHIIQYNSHKHTIRKCNDNRQLSRNQHMNYKVDNEFDGILIQLTKKNIEDKSPTGEIRPRKI